MIEMTTEQQHTTNSIECKAVQKNSSDGAVSSRVFGSSVVIKYDGCLDLRLASYYNETVGLILPLQQKNLTERKTMNRRTFLQAGLGSLALGMAAAGGPLFAAKGKKIPVALQVYSVRDDAKKDMAGTLKKIAKMGYKGVEFAGYYNNRASDIRKMLDDNQLVAISTHLGLPQLLGDEFEKTVEFEKTLGNSNLIVSGGIDKAYSTDAGNRITAYLFNEISLKAEKCGMKIGFHAHGGDFENINGKTAWDLFFSRTRKEIIAQMDIGNCLHGGGNAYESLAKFPGRGTLIHLKSFGNGPTLIASEGDKVDWKKIFNLCENVAGTQWYIVEQESYPGQQTPFAACEECLKNLAKYGVGN